MKKAQSKPLAVTFIIFAVIVVGLLSFIAFKVIIPTTGQLIKEQNYSSVSQSNTPQEAIISPKEYELECKYNCFEIVDGEKNSLIQVVNQGYNSEINSISFEIQNFHQCERRCQIDNGKDTAKVIFLQPLETYQGELEIYNLPRAGITCIEGIEPAGRDCMPNETQVFAIKEK